MRCFALLLPDVSAAVVIKRNSLHRATVGEVIPVNLDAVRAVSTPCTRARIANRARIVARIVYMH